MASNLGLVHTVALLRYYRKCRSQVVVSHHELQVKVCFISSVRTNFNIKIHRIMAHLV